MGLKSLIVRIKGDSKSLDKSLDKSKKSVNKFGKTIKRIGGLIAGAFAVRAIVNFGKEVVQLAAKAKGVETAFNKLNKPDLLKNLRAATRGTVDDLTLMQKAVQAKNFKIPLDQLATYFQFATNRAIETGESVDYLVDSIITGIGRKSVMIMDNLGISAVELQEETKRLGDFGAAAGAIIAREMGNAGDVADTTATKIARITTKWENLKKRVGEALIDSGVVDQLIDAADALARGALSVINPEAGLRMQETASLQKEIADSKEREAELTEWIKETEKEISELGRLKIGQKTKLAAEGNKYFRQLEKERDLQERINKILEDRAKIPPKQTVTKTSVPTTGQFGGAKTGAEKFDPLSPGLHEMGRASAVTYGDAFEASMQERMSRIDWSQLLADMTMNAVSAIEDLVTTAFEAIGSGNYDDIGKNLLIGFADFLNQLGKLLIAFGIAESGFMQSIALGPVGWGVAIAAGTAAIAAAAAIKGAIGSAAESVSGGGGYGGSYKGSTSGSAQPLTNAIQVEGILKGSDIVISSRRYTNNRNSVT